MASQRCSTISISLLGSGSDEACWASDRQSSGGSSAGFFPSLVITERFQRSNTLATHSFRESVLNEISTPVRRERVRQCAPNIINNITNRIEGSRGRKVDCKRQKRSILVRLGGFRLAAGRRLRPRFRRRHFAARPMPAAGSGMSTAVTSTVTA